MKPFPKVTTAVWGLMLFAVFTWATIKYGLARSLFSTEFLPHQYCYLRQPSLVWTNALSDSVIWLSYVAIAVGLAVLLRKTETLLGFRWVFVAFGLFIVACGFTHFFEAVTIWAPLYWLSSSVKVLTAAASVVTAVAFVPLVPRAAEAIRIFSQAYSTSEEQRLSTLAKLLDAEERMRLAFENSGVATWERSLVTKELYWDERCRAMFGMRSNRTLFYEDFLTHIHPDERASTQEKIETSIKTQHEYTATFRIVRDDGEVRTVISRGRALKDENGQPVRLVGIIMDITRERQAQEALVKAEKLAVAGRMAASIAHEINNPLATASALVYLCRTDDRVPQDVQQRLEAVEQELQRAGQITRSTLSFYRESPSPKETDLGELVDSVLNFQQGNIRKAGISLEKELNSTEPILAFPGELRQIFTNLITNAVDATGPNGKLRVRVRPARDWRTGRSGYSVVVADNGSGIPSDARNKLFEAFYSTKGEKGTGLGLWITDQLVRKHDGHVRLRTWCASPDGCDRRTGTVFSVWLPLRPEFVEGGTQTEP